MNQGVWFWSRSIHNQLIEIWKKAYKLGGRRFPNLGIMERSNGKWGIFKKVSTHFWLLCQEARNYGFVSHNCHQVLHSQKKPFKPGGRRFTQMYALGLPGVVVIPLSSWPRGKAVWLVSPSIRNTKSTLSFKPGGRMFIVCITTTSAELPLFWRQNWMGPCRSAETSSTVSSQAEYIREKFPKNNERT